MEKIKDHFSDYQNFTRKELYDFYLKYDNELNPGTFGWRVFNLKKKNIITTVQRGIYKINSKQRFDPVIDRRMRIITNYLINAFPRIDYRIWTTKWINDFSQHMVFRTFYVLEVPYDQTKMVFHSLRKFKVFERPDEEIISEYVIEENNPIVIKVLISRSPVRKKNKTRIPPLEKILVDLFCDTKLFYMFQGEELRIIFRNAIDNYAINFSMM